MPSAAPPASTDDTPGTTSVSYSDASRWCRYMSIPDKAELTPKALHDFHQAEIDKWWPIIKSYGIKVN